METRDQKFALKSYNAVSQRITASDMNEAKLKEYRSFAKSFPALIHTCGLMQAIAFALKDSKKQNYKVLEDFVRVLEGPNADPSQFVQHCQMMPMLPYMQKSRLAMLAAAWIKRQADALIDVSEGE